MTSPFKVEGPALVSFSGGRTSGYMLHEVVEAHGRRLPEDILVAFANTGKEREETLRFVRDCEENWGTRIHWLEWRDSNAGFEVVDFERASRRGGALPGAHRQEAEAP